MNKLYAPIILFTYCRKVNTEIVVNALKDNQEAEFTDLIIYSDAAKNKKVLDKVRETRSYLHTISGFKSISIIEREENWGLAKNLVDGISTVIKKYGRAIIVEDDIKVSPYFLKYMNDGLDTYADNSNVASIHAYRYPSHVSLPETFFIKGADCWGWATWESIVLPLFRPAMFVS